MPLHVQLGAPPHGFPATAKAVPLRFTFAMPPSASVPAMSCAGVTAAVLQAYGEAKLSVDAAPRLVAPLLYVRAVSSRVTANVASAREVVMVDAYAYLSDKTPPCTPRTGSVYRNGARARVDKDGYTRLCGQKRTVRVPHVRVGDGVGGGRAGING